jgi:hypothetical protein
MGGGGGGGGSMFRDKDKPKQTIAKPDYGTAMVSYDDL